MFARTKIALSIIYIVIGIQHVAIAWLAPERCQQDKKTVRSVADTNWNSTTITAPIVNNITVIATNQNKMLNETYKNHKFFGVPIRGYFAGFEAMDYEMYAPTNCTFFTYSSIPLASVHCDEGVTCKLEHLVSTIDSYTAIEGYNWGVKIPPKFATIIEIGGEASIDGTYSCTYTKNRTITDNVECSVSDGHGKTLQLYTVRSDLECQFGTVTMLPEMRNGWILDWRYQSDSFTDAEREMIEVHPLIKSKRKYVLPDLKRMSVDLLEKMVTTFPYYNPYTDLIAINRPRDFTEVLYYKLGSSETSKKKVIPFTNENGDSIFQYACVLT